MEQTYKIIVRLEGKKDLVRTGVDKLNSIVIPAEIEMAYEDAVKAGKLQVLVEKE